MRTRTMPSIHLVLKPSLIICGIYLLVTILCAFSIVVVEMANWLTILALCIVIISVIYIVLRDILLCLPWSWHSIIVSATGELRLLNRQQQQFTPKLSASTVNHPWLTVLNFKPFSLRYHAVILTPFQVVDQAAYRRFRVWLQWWRHDEHVDITP